MDLLYKVKYLTKKAMLMVMGPAELDEHNDPVRRLEREKDEHTGGKTDDKPTKEYPKKRKFEGDGSSTSAKTAATKKPPASQPAAKKAPAAKTAAKKTTSKPRNQPGS
jgi:FtsZ-interacting cell division protein ZipA